MEEPKITKCRSNRIPLQHTASDDQKHLLIALEPLVRRRRGRPKQKEDAAPPEKLMDRIASAIRNHTGHPTVYASTTKGGMKLIYEGHHFRYSFRKGQFSIFQCCYKENKEECKVRVVSDQKRVYPLDGEHVHFIQATDKSVTSMMFEPGANDEANEEPVDELSVATVIDDPEPLYEQANVDAVDDFTTAEGVPDVDPSDFREKIKKRLQKALLGKKK